MPDYAISSIVDNLILMNFVELGNSLRRAITVAKARGSEHQFVTREYTIGPGGISLVPMGKGKRLPVLAVPELLWPAEPRAVAAQPRFAAMPGGRRAVEIPVTPRQGSHAFTGASCDGAQPQPRQGRALFAAARRRTAAGHSCRPVRPGELARGFRKPSPAPRTSRWPWSMRMVPCSESTPTLAQRGVCCTTRNRRPSIGVPFLSRLLSPVPALPTPWPEAALS